MVNDPLALADPVRTTPGSGAPPTSTASTPQNIASVEQMYRLRMLGAYRKFIEAAAHSARLDVADQRARETRLRRVFRAHTSNKTTKTILQKLNRISIAAAALANARRLRAAARCWNRRTLMSRSIAIGGYRLVAHAMRRWRSEADARREHATRAQAFRASGGRRPSTTALSTVATAPRDATARAASRLVRPDTHELAAMRTEQQQIVDDMRSMLQRMNEHEQRAAAQRHTLATYAARLSAVEAVGDAATDACAAWRPAVRALDTRVSAQMDELRAELACDVC